jgi:hypothetical protein
MHGATIKIKIKVFKNFVPKHVLFMRVSEFSLSK